MGGWSHSGTEPAGGVSKLQSINHSTLLRSRSQRVAKLVSSLLLLPLRQEAAGCWTTGHLMEHAGPQDRRSCSGATKV